MSDLAVLVLESLTKSAPLHHYLHPCITMYQPQCLPKGSALGDVPLLAPNRCCTYTRTRIKFFAICSFTVSLFRFENTSILNLTIMTLRDTTTVDVWLKKNNNNNNLSWEVSTVQRFLVFSDSVDAHLYQFMKKQKQEQIVFMEKWIPIVLVDFRRQYFCIKC